MKILEHGSKLEKYEGMAIIMHFICIKLFAARWLHDKIINTIYFILLKSVIKLRNIGVDVPYEVLSYKNI